MTIGILGGATLRGVLPGTGTHGMDLRGRCHGIQPGGGMWGGIGAGPRHGILHGNLIPTIITGIAVPIIGIHLRQVLTDLITVTIVRPIAPEVIPKVYAPEVVLMVITVPVVIIAREQTAWVAVQFRGNAPAQASVPALQRRQSGLEMAA